MHAWTYVCMYVRTYVCMYVYIYICMYVCMHVCMYVFIRIYIYTLYIVIFSQVIYWDFHVVEMAIFFHSQQFQRMLIRAQWEILNNNSGGDMTV